MADRLEWACHSDPWHLPPSVRRVVVVVVVVAIMGSQIWVFNGYYAFYWQLLVSLAIIGFHDQSWIFIGGYEFLMVIISFY